MTATRNDTRLARMLAGTPYLGYAYAYPHKTAYRPIAPAVPLQTVWANEDCRALFLYVHVPFCNVRCSFCNLFTTVNPAHETVADFLAALRRQAMRARAAFDGQSLGISRFAIGGGTPTFLSAAHLAEIFDIADVAFGADGRAIPVAVEASPDTVTAEKLAVLRDRGATRFSMGIQSFLEPETRPLGRPQSPGIIEKAIGLARDAGFPVLNLDLIYGLPGQTRESWRQSVAATLAHRPEELFLYPLYTRPLTGLGRANRESDDIRLACYRDAREMLQSAGYRQITMRLFRHANAPAFATDGPAYCCQTDGMIGLGPGARSYTRGLHYSTDYAVRPKGVREIIAEFIARTNADFDATNYGFAVTPDDARRRFIIQSLLHASGLESTAYAARFGTPPLTDYPELAELETHGLAHKIAGTLKLTADGIERSDVIGPWLYSPHVENLMAGFDAR